MVYAHRVLQNVFLHSEECIRRLLCPVSGLGPCARSVICMIYLAYIHCIPDCHLHIHWVRLWEPNLFCKQDLGFWRFSFCNPHHSPRLWGQYVTHRDGWTCLAPLPTRSVEAQGKYRLFWSLTLPHVRARGAAHELGRTRKFFWMGWLYSLTPLLDKPRLSRLWSHLAEGPTLGIPSHTRMSTRGYEKSMKSTQNNITL